MAGIAGGAAVAGVLVDAAGWRAAAIAAVGCAALWIRGRGRPEEHPAPRRARDRLGGELPDRVEVLDLGPADRAALDHRVLDHGILEELGETLAGVPPEVQHDRVGVACERSTVTPFEPWPSRSGAPRCWKPSQNTSKSLTFNRMRMSTMPASLGQIAAARPRGRLPLVRGEPRLQQMRGRAGVQRRVRGERIAQRLHRGEALVVEVDGDIGPEALRQPCREGPRLLRLRRVGTGHAEREADDDAPDLALADELGEPPDPAPRRRAQHGVDGRRQRPRRGR